MGEQRRHTAYKSIKGTITATTGAADADKLIRTDANGLIDPSLITPDFLSDVNAQRQYRIREAVFEEYSVAPANSDFAYKFGFGENLRDEKHGTAKALAAGQGCSIYVPIRIPFRFWDWDDTEPIKGSLVVNDSLAVTVDAEILHETFGSVATLGFASMTKTALGANELVEFTIPKASLYPVNFFYGLQNDTAIPAETYADEVNMKLDVSFSAVNDFVQFLSLEVKYTESVLEQP